MFRAFRGFGPVVSVLLVVAVTSCSDSGDETNGVTGSDTASAVNDDVIGGTSDVVKAGDTLDGRLDSSDGTDTTVGDDGADATDGLDANADTWVDAAGPGDTVEPDDISQPEDTTSVDIDSGDEDVTDSDTAENDAGGTDTSDDTVGPLPSDPGAPGPYTYTFETGSIVTGTGIFGDETLDLVVLVPEGENLPVVLFMPGAQLISSDYTSTREHLASHGFIVVFPSFSDGSLLDIPDPHIDLKDRAVQVLDWIDEQAAGPWAGVADPTRIAAVGHSLGGKLSFFTATVDDRIDVIAGIDPVDSGPPEFVPFDPADYPSITPELMDQVTVPTLLLGETVNAVADFQACAPEDNNFQQYYAAATAPTLSIELLGANHMSFLDDPSDCTQCALCPAGTDDTEVTRQLTRRFITAFLAATLLENSNWIGWLNGADHQGLIDGGLIVSESKNAFDDAL